MLLIVISINDISLLGLPRGALLEARHPKHDLQLWRCVRLDIKDARDVQLKSQIELFDLCISEEWWVEEDLNLRPHAYQACALTT